MLFMIIFIMMCFCNDEIKFREFYEHLKKNMSMLNHYKTTLKIENIDVKIFFLKSQISTSTSLKYNARHVINF